MSPADVYDAGLCEAVGISNYGPVQLNKFAERMKERDGMSNLLIAETSLQNFC